MYVYESSLFIFIDLSFRESLVSEETLKEFREIALRLRQLNLKAEAVCEATSAPGPIKSVA